MASTRSACLTTCLRYRSKYGKCSSSGYCSAAVAAKSQTWWRGEAVGLRVHAQRLVVGDVHRLGGVAPGGGLLVVDAEVPGDVGVAVGGVGGGAQVLLGHQVGVDVVVGDRAVLVGAGDPVDAEAARRRRDGPASATAGPSRPAAPGRRSRSKLVVAGGVEVADDGVGDVGVDVEGGRAGRPVAGAFLAVDGPPREGGAAQAELAGPCAGQRQGGVPPAQRVGRGVAGDV